MTRRGAILFALLGVTWGIPYLLIKVAVRAGARPGDARAGADRDRGGRAAAVRDRPGRADAAVLRRWRPLLVFTVVESVVPQFLLGSAEERLPSSTTGLLIAAVPLAGVGIAFLLGRPERLAPLNWLGIALGMGGVAALVGFTVAGSDLGAVGKVLVVVAGYALGPAIIAKWLPGVPGTGVMAIGVALTTAAYAPVVAATHSWPSAWPSASVIVSVVLLAVVCSAGGFTIMGALVAEVGPVRATTVTYVNPAVALLAGAVVLGEPVTAWSVVGFALILAGCYLVAARRTSRSGRPEPGLARPRRAASRAARGRGRRAGTGQLRGPALIISPCEPRTARHGHPGNGRERAAGLPRRGGGGDPASCSGGTRPRTGQWKTTGWWNAANALTVGDLVHPGTPGTGPTWRSSRPRSRRPSARSRRLHQRRSSTTTGGGRSPGWPRTT